MIADCRYGHICGPMIRGGKGRWQTSDHLEALRRQGFWTMALFSLACLAPLFTLVYMVSAYHIDAPRGEQWYLARYIELLYKGQFQYRFLFLQDEGEKPVFPTIVLLCLARLTHWNIYYEMLTSIMLAFATWIILTVKLISTFKECGIRNCKWIAFVLSVILFSLAQWENWLWGIRISVYLNILCVVVGLILLTSRPVRPLHVMGAIILAIIATFSFSNGMVFWVIGLIIIVLRKDYESRLVSAVGWSLAAAACLVIFFYDFRLPITAVPAARIPHMPQKLCVFFLGYLGSPLLSWEMAKTLRPFAPYVGTAGLLAVIVASWLLLRLLHVDFHKLVFVLGLAVYAAGSAAMTAIGRVNGGNPLIPRYTTTSSLLWIAVLSLLFMLWRLAAPRETRKPFTAIRVGAASGLVVIIFAFASNSFMARRGFYTFYNNELPREKELFVLKNDQLLRGLFRDTQEIRRLIPFLKANRLCVFRSGGASH
uniref:Transmembrane protein n=1 Tax=uncultured bacterium AOCefta2 TaxID=654977 RepID=D6MLX6_9BACT|nr:hypothetical protein WISOIL_0027 [uncultured bacterium AOCefta2]